MSQKLIQVFTAELDELKDKEFRKHIKNMLEELPDYILDMPSSSTGKYHPQDEVGDYRDGMIRHIKRCAILADEVARMRKHNIDIRDILIAGAILHDMFKQGLNNESHHTVKEHPIYIYDYIREYISKTVFDNNNILNKLYHLSVACILHEGQWTIPDSYEKLSSDITKEEKQIAFSMHIVDYMASRRSLFDIMNPSYYDKELQKYKDILGYSILEEKMASDDVMF